MSLFGSFSNKYTDPNGYTKIEPKEDDITLEPTVNSFGDTVHSMPKDINQEVDELKTVFNSASEQARVIFINRLVKAYPDEVREHLRDVSY